MKKQVTPAMLIGAGVLLLALIGMLFMRTARSNAAPEYTISAPGNDADGVTAKRANILKAKGLPPAPASTGTDTRQ